MIRGPITDGLLARAAAFGAQRRSDSRKDGLAPVSHAGGESGSWDEEGALGEFIVSEVLGLPEPRIGSYKTDPDVGPFEVQAVTRTAADTRRTSLIIRPSDLEQGCADRPYILVVIREARFEMPGWLWGHEGEGLGDVWTEGGKPCYLVSPVHLHEFDLDFYRMLTNWRIKQL